MNDMQGMIRSAVAYQLDSHGKVRLKRVKGSSISLPEIDEKQTKKNVESLMSDLLSRIPREQVLAGLKGAVSSVKSMYMLTHDGFRVAKGAKKIGNLTVGDVYSFAVAAGYCFDLLPAVNQNFDIKIGIGVMAPAIQDCGKNLIKLMWKSAGFDVVDLGNTVHPENWIEEIIKRVLTTIGISCMANRCIDNLGKLLESMARRSLDLPVVIGGIAVSRSRAYDLTQRYGISVYYGHDLSDATKVLERALERSPVEVPVVKAIEKIEIPTDLLMDVDGCGFKLFKIRISDVVLDKNARDGCASCTGDKRMLCPLDVGYERQKSLEESIKFINRYQFAVLVLTDFHDVSDRFNSKAMWEGLLRVEQHFSSLYNDAYAFRLPITCPYCLPKECKLPKSECAFPYAYRQVHEQYNIDMIKTQINVLGEKHTGEGAIILVR
jgi:methylmalonyl-CoA mutase cobalamin-binding subunit